MRDTYPYCLCRAYDDVLEQVYTALTCTVIASPLPEASWFSAAECALAAIYALHPAPEQLCAAILRHMASRAFQSRAVEAAVAVAGAEAQVWARLASATQPLLLKRVVSPAAGSLVSGLEHFCDTVLLAKWPAQRMHSSNVALHC